MVLDKESLLHLIEEAFPLEPLGAGISLRQAIADDEAPWEGMSAEIWATAYARDVTSNWRMVPDEDLQWAFSQFSLFTYLDEAGYRYYLPAVMHCAVRDPLSQCSERVLSEFIFYSQITESGPIDAKLRRILSSVQIKTVAEFIKYAIHHEDEFIMPSTKKHGARYHELLKALCE